MPVSGPTRCPECNYSLRGLPPPHRCPECGFEYDEHTLIWRPEKPWRVLIPWLIMAMLVLPQILTPNRAGFRDFRVVGYVVLCISFIFVAAHLWRAYIATRAGRYVAITPTGVRCRGHNLGQEVIASRNWSSGIQIPWAEIDGLELEYFRRRCIVLVRRRRPLRDIRISHIVDDVGGATHFISKALSAQRRYAADVGQPPGAGPLANPTKEA